jgi:hypothetical protein
MSCPDCQELNRRLTETTTKLEALRRESDLASTTASTAAITIRADRMARARRAQAYTASAFEAVDRVSYSTKAGENS